MRNVTYGLNIDGGEALQSVGMLEDNLARLNAEIREVDGNSAAFVTLSAEIQRTTDELDGANRAIEGFTGEDRRKALQGSIDLFTGSITAIAGVGAQLGLLGDEADEAIANLLGVAAAASGVSMAVQGYLDLTVALEGSTAAQLLYNRAANANPYALLAGAVIALTVAYIAFADEVDDARIAQNKANDAVREANLLIDSSIESQIARAEAANLADDAEILRLQSLNTVGRLSAEQIIRNNTEIEQLRTTIGIRETVVSQLVNDEIPARTAAELLRQQEIEDLRDLQAGLGAEDDESTILGAKKALLLIELAQTEDYNERRAILRDLALLQEGLDEANEDRPKNLQAIMVATSGLVEMEGAQIEQKRVDIKVNDTQTENAMSNIDAQVGAFATFASAANQAAQENKALAIASVITNAAVAGIGLWRSWNSPQAPFGPIGNQIALGASLLVLAGSSAVAIDSITSAASGGGGSSSVGSMAASSRQVSAPSQSPSSNTIGQGTSLSEVMSAVNNQSNSVLLTPKEGAGSLTATTRADERRNNKSKSRRG